MSFQELATKRDVVVIGASAGGVSALLTLCSSLPENFPAAVLIVLHIGANSSVLPMLLTSHGHNRALHPVDGQKILPGTIYLAPPDQHMVVDGDVIRLNRGPKEHHTRPAIDPLFRSAAVAFGARCIGVVLTGRLDDGTAGLLAIKGCGGVVVVQDPDEAEFAAMPRSVLQSMAVDHRVRLKEMGSTLLQLLSEPLGAPRAEDPATLERLASEVAITLGAEDAMEKLNALGRPSSFTCPDCEGVLWAIEDTRPARYRCHTGHAFSLRSLEQTQSAATEDALWAAIRALQAREELLRRIAAQNRSVGAEEEALENEARADEAASQAHVLHRMLDER